MLPRQLGSFQLAGGAAVPPPAPVNTWIETDSPLSAPVAADADIWLAESDALIVGVKTDAELAPTLTDVDIYL